MAKDEVPSCLPSRNRQDRIIALVYSHYIKHSFFFKIFLILKKIKANNLLRHRRSFCSKHWFTFAAGDGVTDEHFSLFLTVHWSFTKTESLKIRAENHSVNPKPPLPATQALGFQILP